MSMCACGCVWVGGYVCGYVCVCNCNRLIAKSRGGNVTKTEGGKQTRRDQIMYISSPHLKRTIYTPRLRVMTYCQLSDDITAAVSFFCFVFVVVVIIITIIIIIIFYTIFLKSNLIRVSFFPRTV